MLGKKLVKAAAGAGGAESDDDFASTVLLLHGDGTSGAQNNTFLDSSTNNFTITRAGNTTQGSFSPFSKPDGAWGNYFDGVDEYLEIADNATLDAGTADMWVEAWFYYIPTTGVDTIIHKLNGSSVSSPGWLLRMNTNTLEFIHGPANSLTTTSYGTSLTPHTWYHVAVSRSGTGSNEAAIFLNGSRVVQFTMSSDFQNTAAVRIGRTTATGSNYFEGYLSNIRLGIGGFGPYDPAQTNVTVPTSPLTAVTNTVLLTCQSNRFVDNSANNWAISVNNTPVITPFSPFPITTEYTPSVNGGSMYSDGVGDYLSWTGSSLAGDFTAECWVYPTAVDTSGYTVILGKAGANVQFNAIRSANAIGLVINGTTVIGASGDPLPLNAWHHLAWVRESTTCRAYVNGVEVGTGTSSATVNISYIGVYSSGGYELNGYMSSLRVLDGTCLYPSGTTFTPPTAPLTAITDTELLCNFTNAGILDNTCFNALESVGGAQIDTTTKKFGTGSIEFDGTGDYLNIPYSDNWNMASGDFTIEGWFYATSSSGYRPIVSLYGAGGTQWIIALDGTNYDVYVYPSGTNLLIHNGAAPSASTWVHFALVRDGANFKFFSQGTLAATVASQTLRTVNQSLGIGTASNGTYVWTGYIDDLRITKGVARYTTTFTPPTKAFPNVGV